MSDAKPPFPTLRPGDKVLVQDLDRRGEWTAEPCTHEVENVIDSLRAEVERVRRLWGICRADRERTRTEVERVTRERDEAMALLGEWIEGDACANDHGDDDCLYCRSRRFGGKDVANEQPE